MKNTIDGVILRLDTEDSIPATDSLELARLVVDRVREILPPDDAEIVIRGMGEGTWWIHLCLLVGAIGAFAKGTEGLIADIKAGNAPFAQQIARTLDTFSGSNVQVLTDDIEETIPRSDIQFPVTRPVAIDGARMSFNGDRLVVRDDPPKPAVEGADAHGPVDVSDLGEQTLSAVLGQDQAIARGEKMIENSYEMINLPGNGFLVWHSIPRESTHRWADMVGFEGFFTRGELMGRNQLPHDIYFEDLSGRKVRTEVLEDPEPPLDVPVRIFTYRDWITDVGPEKRIPIAYLVRMQT